MKESNDYIIEETEDFIAFDIETDHGLVAAISNKTDHDICFCPYGVWKEFIVPANRQVILSNDYDGSDTRYAMIMGDYDYCKL